MQSCSAPSPRQVNICLTRSMVNCGSEFDLNLLVVVVGLVKIEADDEALAGSTLEMAVLISITLPKLSSPSLVNFRGFSLGPGSPKSSWLLEGKEGIMACEGRRVVRASFA